MAKGLERDLGLFSVIAISIGAMVGSGIFILPGLAYELAGSGIVLAYLLAGVLVLPAAVSKSEMATAMPEAGGTYLYIERSMGPLLGTIAGIGTWFSLAFKGSLALIGGAPYLVLLFDLPVKPVAVALALGLIAVNLVGVKQTGRTQVAIVVAMLCALAWFIVGGIPTVEPGTLDRSIQGTPAGIVAATGFIFVSYAGVTKIASVAEEIERPDRNIPLGILGSLVFTTALYVVIVYVTVGVLPVEAIDGEVIAVANAAEATLGDLGVTLVVIAALLALISTANAGLLASSRYPFAMSRDELVPAGLARIHDRFRTPSHAITLTGGIMLVLIVFVPIADIAKLASAFQIIVFVLVNLALIAFRESAIDWYEPSFRSPLYPWLQLGGVVGGLILLTQLDLVPSLGAVVIIAGSAAWYYWYARDRIAREGAAAEEVRRSVGDRAVDATATAIEATEEYELLIALTEEATREHERTLLRLGADIARSHDGRVAVVWFESVPDQVPLEVAVETQTPAEVRFERQTEELSAALDVPVDYGEIVSHDVNHAIRNFATHIGADGLMLDRHVTSLPVPRIGSSTDWLLRHAPCDVFLIEDRGLRELETIGVLTDRGPYDPVKVMVAGAIAVEAGASVTLLYALEEGEPASHRRMLEDYHDDLVGLLPADTEVRIVETASGHGRAAVLQAVRGFDLLLTRAAAPGIRGLLFDRWIDEVIRRSKCTTVLIYPKTTESRGPFRRLVERWFF